MTRRPIITLTSDFGTRDFYVAAMKAALLRHCSGAQLIDVTHEVPRHDVLAGSIVLERAVASFAPCTVHLAVIDPGVGSQRRLLVAEVAQQTIVCPDNGLITWSWRRHGGGLAHELIWRPPQTSMTFHGRDILAPVAAQLAAGVALADLARPMDDPVLLDVDLASGPAGQIIHIDHFGNATTNIPEDLLQARQVQDVKVNGRSIGPLRRTYADVAAGEALALIGSSGLLEIAVREGSAKAQLSIRVRDPVIIEQAEP